MSPVLESLETRSWAPRGRAVGNTECVWVLCEEWKSFSFVGIVMPGLLEVRCAEEGGCGVGAWMLVRHHRAMRGGGRHYAACLRMHNRQLHGINAVVW
jgi:hypothetical protein